MNNILVTGATGFLGYHVVRRLNSVGVRPRVLELRGSNLDVLSRLDVQRCEGYLDDAGALTAACSGVDTVLHLGFKVIVGDGPEQLKQMQQVNVDGTRRLLQTAAANGVRRAVVVGSALAVGVNKAPVPLDESADWNQHAFDFQYALIRRQAELDSLAQTTPQFAVISVCPSFTFGPDDPVGAPANKLLQRIVAGKMPVTLPIGFGCLDVRDFAQGMLLAAENGRPGQRYLLSGDNITATQLLEQTAAITGGRVPRFSPPKFLLHGLVGALEVISKLRGKPAPVSRSVLQLLGRYAWYDTSKARTELGWTSRPLAETLQDTIRSQRTSTSTNALPVDKGAAVR